MRCYGHEFAKRVISKCDLLVMDDKEYTVDVDIRDLDGAEGAMADYYYTGEEKSFLTSSFATFLTGILDSTKDSVITPMGEVKRTMPKTKCLVD